MRKFRGFVVAGAVATAVLAAPATAAAETDSGQGFGQHVLTCAQTMGFDGTHNPGMHQGFASWDGMHEC
jgi:hypothetical protein